ncbi:MAG: hypothetical protein BTN85_0883 [Candidatus Methanohalarchaeum thermophilum]|uniref:Methanogenesis marker 17 protein n=1 Tax=Methanohalarchaeum thermophilum TaxID=1903181 RepID=A0A1Q6DVQ5_METT1|nr:MAG: hypothetical protein BTN85_0883 [Candidatus Methanohalarchaeum thermophilum]
MNIEVRGQDKSGNESYKEIAENLISESNISTLINKAEILAEPQEPFFIISIATEGVRSTKKVEDISILDESDEGCQVIIKDERYATDLLSKLWEEFGKSDVEQSERLKIICHGVSCEEIEDLELEPEEEMRESIINLIWQIIPEGFRVRKSFVSNDKVTMLASEDRLKEKWIKKANNIHEDNMDE